MRWDREKFPEPSLHVYGKNGAKIIVYNVRRCTKKRRIFGKRYRKKIKKYDIKRKDSRFFIILFRLRRG